MRLFFIYKQVNIYDGNGEIIKCIGISELYEYEYRDIDISLIEKLKQNRLAREVKMSLPNILPYESNLISIDIDMYTDIDKLKEVDYIKSIHRSISGSGIYCIIKTIGLNYIEEYNYIYTDLCLRIGVIIDYLPTNIRVITDKKSVVYINHNNIVNTRHTKFSKSEFNELEYKISKNEITFYVNDDIINESIDTLCSVEYIHKIYNNKITIHHNNPNINTYIFYRYDLSSLLGVNLLSNNVNINESFILHINSNPISLNIPDVCRLPSRFEYFNDNVYSLIVNEYNNLIKNGYVINRGLILKNVNTKLSKWYRCDMSIDIQKNNQYTINLYYHGILVSRLCSSNENKILDDLIDYPPICGFLPNS